MSLSTFRWGVSESAEIGILTKLLPFLIENSAQRFSNPFLHYDQANKKIYFCFENMQAYFLTSSIQPDLLSIQKIVLCPQSENELKVHQFFWSHMEAMGFLE